MEIGFQVIGEDGEPLGHEDTLSDLAAIEVSNAQAWWETAWQTVETAGTCRTCPDPVEEIEAPKKKKER